MGEYQVIARKWRPQNFNDVVGQEHVVRTLKNAIRQNRTGHAYLFVGPRGVGKTTLARIFAKAMNCEAPEDGNPCCKCRSCVSIADENSLDVIEIDAASHNSAGDMRGIAEEVMHTPVAGRYKIYIIDEVHMLSKAAWNALLKTVEEPPAHVKFIFATTEVHQVLPTIISRCQRFDLLPISTRLIAERLGKIAAAEQVKIESGAINAIARAAEGGMRDAQSLLDQMIAFFAGDAHEITGEEVLSLFGLTNRDDLFALLEGMLGNRPAQSIGVIHRLAAAGKNLETLYDDLLAALRAIRIALLLERPGDILEDDPETIELYRRLAAGAPPDAVPVLLETLSPVGRVLHDALNKQIFLETIVLKAMREAHAVKLSDVLVRLNQLRQAGELKFLDQLPAGKPEAPVTVQALPEPKPAPAPVPEVKPEPAPAPEVKPEPVPIPEPEPAPAAPPPEEPVAPEAVAETSAPREEAPSAGAVFSELVKLAEPLKSGRVFAQGAPESFAGSILAVAFAGHVPAADFELLTGEIAQYHRLIQNFTGDWASAVKFDRHVERTPIAPEAVAETPAPAIEPKTETLHVDEPPLREPEMEDPPEEEPAESMPPTAPVAAKAPPAVPAEPEHSTAPPEKSGKRRSVANDRPEALEAAKKQPVIQDVLDLFGGDIVDLHCKE